ncbi:protein masquerade [Bombyx mori]|uniref:Peptidase S1 domain-containing protein n=1 Tax=Bombyx mori TaxID=7091 RepID=A0A8R1WGS0_BOMMO|nr:protein masquerade [Bombyx mori]
MTVSTVLVLLAVLTPLKGQDDLFSSGFLSGILDSLDQTVKAKSCPGICKNAFAAYFCNKVLEEDDDACPDSSMKCCMDEESDADNYITTTALYPVTTIEPGDSSEEISTRAPEKDKDSGSAACTGICVDTHLAQYCDAYFTAQDMCVKGKLCCVSQDKFKDRRPSDLVVPIEKKQSSKRPSTALTTTSPPKRKYRKCKGECTGGLAALFCDRVDEDADCPNLETCCLKDTRLETTTRRPASSPRPRPRPTQPPLPACPGYCFLNLMAAFCPRPSVILTNTDCKNIGSLCCDTRPTATTTTTTTTTPAPVDPRPDCPGSCIVALLSFTCFRNAELTNVFKCKKTGTQCCAPKSKIQEALGRVDRNDSLPLAPPPPHQPPAHSPPHALYTTPYTHTTPVSPFEPNYVSTLTSTEKYNKYVCGVKGTTGRSARRLGERHGRVMGGEDGERGEWCWQVALINSLNQYLCGAALIGTQWVLTAAHCVTNIVRSGDTMYVRVGDHDLTRKYGSPGAQTLRVATTYIHHNHNSQTLDNDIALLKLQGKAELKEGVCLVCLPARGVSHAAGKRCTVTGYGYMAETGPIPLRVREAEIPIVSDAECIRKVNAVTEKIFILPASSFCAGGEEGNDACQGDGGGPLVCQDDGFYELAGLVSWGFGCGRRDVPGVYVKVSAFIGWINQIISVNNNNNNID